MADLFVNDTDRIVGASLTSEEFAAISPFLADPFGQKSILELFSGLIRQLSVDRRRIMIESLSKTLQSSSDAELAEFAKVIVSKG